MYNENDKNELKSIGLKLKQARTALNLLQSDMPINKNQYSNYEQGLYAMNILTFKQICEMLQCSSDYLLGLNSELSQMSKDKQAIWHIIKNMPNDKIQQLKGILIFLNQSGDKYYDE